MTDEMKTDRWLRRILVSIGVFAILLTGSAEARKPNVIMILADDQGSVDLNCYGATDLATPELDQLASQGVRFTQFYAAAPVCSPSRAAFITGLFPQRAGVPGNVSSHSGNAGMPAATPTVAELFAANGYMTGHVGKWHLGYTPATMPNGQGFVDSFGHMGGCIDNYSHFFYWNGPNRHDLWRNGTEVFYDGDFFPDLMAAEAVRFIEDSQDRPFMMYWALNTPPPRMHLPPQTIGQAATASANHRQQQACGQNTVSKELNRRCKQQWKTRHTQHVPTINGVVLARRNFFRKFPVAVGITFNQKRAAGRLNMSLNNKRHDNTQHKCGCHQQQEERFPLRCDFQLVCDRSSTRGFCGAGFSSG